MVDQVANTISQLEGRLRAAVPADVDYASVRFSEERGEYLSVRRGVVEPVTTSLDAGVMITVWVGGGHGYAATSDLTSDGLAAAAARAKEWAARTAGRSVVDMPPFQHPTGFYESPVEQSWDDTSLVDRIDLLRHADA